MAVECLTRGPLGTNLERADILFEYVRRKGVEETVDRACITGAFAAAASGGAIAAGLRVHMNVHAVTVERSADFPAFVAGLAGRWQVPLSQVTMELIEHGLASRGAGFLPALRRLQELGVAIALDDIGCGMSSFAMVLDCRAAFYKLDCYLVRGVRGDRGRQAIIAALSTLARDFGARLVAEGVEEEQDLTALLALGVDLIQGHMFSEAVAPELLSGRLRCRTVAPAHCLPAGKGA